MKVKKVIALAAAAVMTAVASVSAFGADTVVFKGTSDEGVGANAAEWPWALSADETAIEMTRADASKDQILVDFNLGKSFDTTGYNYLVADMYFSDKALLNYVEHAWIVVGSDGDIDNKNLRLTAFGYAKDGEGTGASGSELTKLNAGEWVTVAFPLNDSWAWDSHPDAFDKTAFNKFRLQFMYGGGALLVPASATISIKNVRLSTSATGEAAVEAPAETAPAETTEEPAKTSPATGDMSGMSAGIAAVAGALAVTAFTVSRKRNNA